MLDYKPEICFMLVGSPRDCWSFVFCYQVRMNVLFIVGEEAGVVLLHASFVFQE